MRKTTILIATEKLPPDFAGAGLRALRFTQRMKDNCGYNVKMVCSYKKNKSELDESLSISRLNVISENSILFPMHLVEMMVKVNIYMFRNRKNIDIIHSFGFTWLNRVIMLSNILFYKKPTMVDVTLEGVDDPESLQNSGWKNRIFRPITRVLLKRVDKFIVPSSHSMKSCLKLGKSKSDVLMLPHPCDREKFASIGLNKKYHLRKKLGLPRNAFILVNIGRIQPRKNQLFLAECVKALKDNRMMLLLIGPSDNNDRYCQSIVKFIKENHLDERVKLLGERTNVNEYLVASDISIFSSQKEGFPNVIAESIVSGTPVITSRLECLERYVNNETGIMISNSGEFNNRTVLQFVNAIESAYNKQKRFNRENIRAFGIKHLSTEVIDKEYRKLYEMMIK